MPLKLEATTDLPLAPFAIHFLTLAPRPKGWTFVAPGIGTFASEAHLHAIYALRRGYDDEDAFRRMFTTISEKGEEVVGWVSLLLPCVGVGAEYVPSPAGGLDDGGFGFDGPYGYGRFTVGRRAGLYTEWADERDGDLVRLVCPSGRMDAVEFGGGGGGRCPWGYDRSPRLAEVLGHWADLVEEGVWAVGEDGVEGGTGWFEEHLDEARLSWDEAWG